MKRYSLEREREYYSKVPSNTLESYGPLIPYLYSLVRSPEDVFRDKKVLEIGAGPAQYSWLISDQYSPRKMIAVDLMAHQLLRFKRQLNAAGVRAVSADCFSLPFRSETFDVVFGSLVLAQFGNLREFLQEIGRVLFRGGQYFGIEPSLQNPMHLIRHFLGKHSQNEVLQSVGWTRQEFQAAGFQVEVTRLAPRFPILTQFGLSTCIGIRARKQEL